MIGPDCPASDFSLLRTLWLPLLPFSVPATKPQARPGRRAASSPPCIAIRSSSGSPFGVHCRLTVGFSLPYDSADEPFIADK